jgi:hypothetical protein
VKKMVGIETIDILFWVFMTIGISVGCGGAAYLLGLQQGNYYTNQRWEEAGFQLEDLKERV